MYQLSVIGQILKILSRLAINEYFYIYMPFSRQDQIFNLKKNTKH